MTLFPALGNTPTNGDAHSGSPRRQSLWKKGEFSGNRQPVIDNYSEGDDSDGRILTRWARMIAELARREH